MEQNTFDSKFRFVIVAAQRAKQLLKGERPRIKSKYKNPIRIAQEEVRTGAVQYEILPYQPEEAGEEEVILTEALPLEAVETETEATVEEHDQELIEPEEGEEIGEEDIEGLSEDFEVEEEEEVEDEDQSDEDE
ncbi:MAG TPA: DNA-directed RNA polymerase subunit omega [Candidatus Saccharicenans sp.]|nr:DNA-directed RNA polymerase subunit omega [Candidatus Saccharicenans sp.]HOM94092.1 DNA-directed RNA polymerase subunit omega [Candidatus Saccharicenans sp.]HOT68365.1 DNA-directed RNA polymerase subunit omega [Candidatus Saccharicenans sp.]HPC88165.1 DNA-directed RNA polymerase subunit omega [Candidatus Saccharicenans sp.]HQE63828.1 DNA-directed RNA polymerase subunit omega [Candidatus Saccharicenans sp.]